jgi:hypothetical protein
VFSNRKQGNKYVQNILLAPQQENNAWKKKRIKRFFYFYNLDYRMLNPQAVFVC